MYRLVAAALLTNCTFGLNMNGDTSSFRGGFVQKYMEDGLDEKDLPRFLIIGAQKSGTTFWRGSLFTHPKLTTNCASNETSLESGLLLHLDMTDPSTFAKVYAHKLRHNSRLCPRHPDGFIFEDKPKYLEGLSPGRISLIAQALPQQTKFVLFLRDPLERLVSQLAMDSCFWGSEANQCLVDEATRIMTRLDPSEYHARKGMYATHLKKWMQHVPRSRLLVFYFEDALSDPLRVANKILSATGLKQFDAMPRAVSTQPDRQVQCRVKKCDAPARDKIKAAAADRCESVREFYRTEIGDLGSLVGKSAPASWSTCDMDWSDERLAM